MGRCKICGATQTEYGCHVCHEIPMTRSGFYPWEYPVLTMRVWYNILLPVSGYMAMMFFGLIAARRQYKPLTWLVRHYEEIHKAQALDFRKEDEKRNWRAYVRYYRTYMRQVWKYGYGNTPFEREAKTCAPYPEYLARRERRAWEKFK